MKKILSRLDLFEKVTRLVDVAAIAWYALDLAIDCDYVNNLKKYLELGDEDITMIRNELRDFFSEETGQ